MKSSCLSDPAKLSLVLSKSPPVQELQVQQVTRKCM